MANQRVPKTQRRHLPPPVAHARTAGVYDSKDTLTHVPSKILAMTARKIKKQSKVPIESKEFDSRLYNQKNSTVDATTLFSIYNIEIV
jgi:hypothetical protein